MDLRLHLIVILFYPLPSTLYFLASPSRDHEPYKEDHGLDRTGQHERPPMAHTFSDILKEINDRPNRENQKEFKVESLHKYGAEEAKNKIVKIMDPIKRILRPSDREKRTREIKTGVAKRPEERNSVAAEKIEGEVREVSRKPDQRIFDERRTAEEKAKRAKKYADEKTKDEAVGKTAVKK